MANANVDVWDRIVAKHDLCSKNLRELVGRGDQHTDFAFAFGASAGPRAFVSTTHTHFDMTPDNPLEFGAHPCPLDSVVAVLLVGHAAGRDLRGANYPETGGYVNRRRVIGRRHVWSSGCFREYGGAIGRRRHSRLE
jgi:hypothetical protein